MRITVIIPFHRNLAHVGQSLAAARRAAPQAEIIVAADGAVDDCRPLASAVGAVVVDVPGPSGPAVARNRAASLATGEMLVFVDADVVVAEDAIRGMHDLLTGSPEVVAVFGAYDREPPAPNFMSQFKNLSHCYVHETGSPEASTFWAGMGAVRADVFRSLGGFDERFGRPSVEDIEFGYRMLRAGRRIRLHPRVRGTHLKRWTLWSCVVTDIRGRGIPWTQLIHRHKPGSHDLNTRLGLRLSVVAAYGLTAAVLGIFVSPWSGVLAAALAIALVVSNLGYYRWMARHRGVLFAVRVLPAHFVHHLSNGISFVAGTMIHLANRAGVRLPGALPDSTWTHEQALRQTAASGPSRA